MFDSTESSFPKGFSTIEPFLEGLSGNTPTPLDAAVRDLSGQANNQNSLQSLSAQKLMEPPALVAPILTALPATLEQGAASDFATQNPFEPRDLGSASQEEVESLSGRASERQILQTADVLLTGGTLDQASLNSADGTFVVDESGLVEINFLFDGGAYSGELAVFTLAGMGGLDASGFAKEAARRALSGTSEGQIVIVDSIEGAQFSGELGERDRNQGSAASSKSLTLSAGTRFALMLAPNSTIAAVSAGKASGPNIPLFSISAFNPKGNSQLAQAAKGIFAMEDMQIGKGDADFNDIIFQIEGASSSIPSLSQLTNPTKIWLANPTAQPFLALSQSPEGNSGEESPEENPGGNPGENPSSPPQNPPENPPTGPTDPVVEPPLEPAVTVDISGDVNKFTKSASEADIVATGANSITIGTQTVYIGTEQVSANNQNPIIRSFDAVNSENNWTRQDLETTGTDGRGLGLIWTETALYGVFSVDGAQGKATEDFRRATGGVQQSWLSSYGMGGGSKVAVIGQIDPATGALLKAAYLSAVKQDGKTNSLFITGATVNNAGNLVVSAKSYFNPRRSDGSAMIKDSNNTQDSPFDYTVEITADLTQVVSTAAAGWS